jgi:hypothetical protein
MCVRELLDRLGAACCVPFRKLEVRYAEFCFGHEGALTACSKLPVDDLESTLLELEESA